MQVEEQVRDPYDVLGVSPGAGANEVERAYRRPAKNVHPTSPAPERRRRWPG